MFKNLLEKISKKFAKKKLCKNDMGRPLRDISDQDIQKLLQQGLSNIKIAKILKCSEWTIRDRRKRFKI